MPKTNFAEKRPILFSLLILVLAILVQGAGVFAAQRSELPATAYAVHSGLALALLLAVIVSGLRWWREIGFRGAGGWRALLLFAPAFIHHPSFFTPIPILLKTPHSSIINL